MRTEIFCVFFTVNGPARLNRPVFLRLKLLFYIFLALPFSGRSRSGGEGWSAVIASVLAGESLHKTEICTGSGLSQDQIKSSQVFSGEAIHSRRKNDSVFVFSARRSAAGRLAALRRRPSSPLFINPRLTSHSSPLSLGLSAHL